MATTRPEDTGGQQVPPTQGGIPEKATLPPEGMPLTQARQPTGAPSAPEDLTAPALAIPGYEILGVLGRGGMGVVYKARQQGLDRVVALKMIPHAAHAGDVEHRRFQAEAEAIARLQHPHIVQVFEVGAHEGCPYLALEFCSGGSLSEKLDGTPWRAERSAQLMRILADAMHAAHHAQIVHRDLKPGNVLLTADGRPKITDFGLAKKLDEQSRTQTGAILGTPSYMAPEQAAGKGREVGPAADVYALGAILYELLTGRPPFRAATTLDTVLQMMSEEPVPPSRLEPKVPRDLETICLKCLQKEPARRYASAQALADDLDRFTAGEPIRARPTPAWERGWKWARRNPAAALVIFLFAVPLPCLLVFMAVLWLGASEARDQARSNAALEKEARDQAEGAATREAEARRRADDEHERTAALLYATSITLAHREWSANNLGRVGSVLDGCPPRFRGWEWDYLHRLSEPEEFILRSGVINTHVVWSPNGDVLASGGNNNAVTLWDARTGAELRKLSGRADRPAFSPDGRRLLAASGTDVGVWDVYSGRLVLRIRANGKPISGIAFVDGGRAIATADEAGAMKFWDARQGRQMRAAARPISTDGPPAFSPDGKKLAAGGSDAQVKVWDTETGELLWQKSGHLQVVREVAFSPDGKRLASAGGEGAVRIWDVESGNEVKQLRGHGSWVCGVAWSADGRRLLSGSRDLTARLWDPARGESLGTFRGHVSEVWGLAFSPDSRHIATASPDGSVRVWDTQARLALAWQVRIQTAMAERFRGFARAASQEAVTFYGHLGANWDAAFSGDGTLMATSGIDDGIVKVWDVASRKELHSLKLPWDGLNALAFAPKGRGLAVAAGSPSLPPGHLRVFDLETSRTLFTQEGPSCAASGVAFTPDGGLLAVVFAAPQGSEVRMMEAESGKIVWSRKVDAVQLSQPALAADGRLLVVAGQDGAIRLWNTGSGTDARPPLNHPGGALDVACSSAGVLASAGNDWKIRLWEIATGRALAVLEGHVGPVISVAFSPDGRRLASSGLDMTVKVWDVATARDLLTLRDHANLAYNLAWSPDGRRLASASQDGTTKVWETDAPPDTSGWQTVFRDNFEELDWEKRWKWRDGRWSLQDGALRSQQTAHAPDGGMVRANADLKAEVPATTEVLLDCRASAETDFEVQFVDGAGQHAVIVAVLGTNQSRGHKGIALVTESHGQFAALAENSDFTPEPLRWYRMRIVREPRRVSVFADGRLLLSAAAPPLETPRLTLQALRGAEGTTWEVAKLEVRAPEEALRTQRMRDVVAGLFDAALPRTDVRQRLREDANLTEPDRNEALRMAEDFPENADKMNAAARAALLRPMAEGTTEGLTWRRAEAAARLDPYRGEFLETRALALYRSEKMDEALAAVRSATEATRLELGSQTPVQLALSALCQRRLGKEAEARARLRALRDLMRSRSWAARDDARRLQAEAEQSIGPTLLPPSAAQRDEEAIKDAVIRAEQANRVEHDKAAWFALLTQDVRVVWGRGVKPGPHDIINDRRRLEALSPLELAVPRVPSISLDCEDLEATVAGDAGTLRGRLTLRWDGGFETSGVDYRLRRTAWGWKAFDVRAWQLAKRTGPELVFYDADSYRRLDDAVNEMRGKGDNTALARALVDAKRFTEAHAIARELTAGPTAAVEDWVLRAEVALQNGDANDTIRCLREVRARKPDAVPLSMRAMLAEEPGARRK
jgi:WD40 repeat protein/tRNA A-37 threonylcarbamoyl transferase component Bud32